MKFGARPGEDFDDGVKDQVDHERNAPAVAIGDEAEYERADRAESQGERQAQGHLGDRFVVGFGDRRKGHYDQEKIEGIQRPAEESGKNYGERAL